MSTSDTYKINYPALYKSSDKASIKSQNLFIKLNLFNILSLVLASTLSSIPIDENYLAIISAVFLIVSLILTSLMFYIKFEKKWYEGRAIAESIKTLTWKFMMGASPFEADSFTIVEAEERLINEFKKIIGQRKDYFDLIGGDFGTGEQITTAMRNVREFNIEKKKSIYLRQRLDEQRTWYSSSSNRNRSSKNISFWTIIALIVASFIGLYLNLNYENLKIIITPISVVIASSIIAWMNLKRFQELTQSYSITANELGLIRSKAHHITKESELSDFVDDAENAISREHTLWLARRDNIELFK
ncbi:DUF4231 domain-containing protein [Reichenbachiella sp.]